MRLPDFSRYEIFANGSTIAVCDTNSNAVIQPSVSATGIMYGLFSDKGERKTFSERRLREAFNFGVSPLSFKLPLGGNRYSIKDSDFAKKTTEAAMAIEQAISGDIRSMQMILLRDRETAIRKACATLKIVRTKVERFIDIAEESLIERLKGGHYSSVRPLDEMLANEVCRLIELSKKTSDNFDKITTNKERK